MDRTPLLWLIMTAFIISTSQAQSATAASPDHAFTEPVLKEPDVDPYFDSSLIDVSETGPQTITRNVLQDRQGGYWLATWNGIVRYDGTTFSNVTNQAGLRRYRTFSLLEDREKNIWIGTVGAGVYRYDGATYTNFTTEDGLIDNRVLSILQDKDDNIWFGGLGVTTYDGTTFKSYGEKDGFTDSDVNSISQSTDGSIWFGTRGALFQYDGNQFVNFTKREGLHISSYIPTVMDRHGNLWFGGDRGIYHYDGTTLRHLFPYASYSLFEDSTGNIWFSGGSLRGEDPKPGTTVLNRFDPADGLEGMLTKSTQFEVAAGRGTFGIAEDKEGNIWFGTGRGVGRIDGDSKHSRTEPHAYPAKVRLNLPLSS